MRLSCCLLGLTLTTLVGCSKPETTDVEPVTRPVKLVQVDDGSARLKRQFPAVVEPTENARLTFRVSGKLTQFSIRPGQEVKQGQVLGTLDQTDFKLRVEQAKARQQLAKAQFDRSASLIEQKLVSHAVYDEAKAQLQVAEADLKTAETNLSYTNLIAPFSGIVSRTLVENHENVAAQQAILELQLKGMVDVVIQVPEDVIALVKKDQTYQPDVVFDSYPSLSYKATIKEWDTRADSATNSFKVVFSMPAPTEFNVLSGMTANLIADLSSLMQLQANTVLVPASAVFSANDQPTDSKEQFVWVYVPAQDAPALGTVERRAVATGRLTQQGLEIRAGLKAGEQVVTAGVHQLKAGLLVRPWQRERGL